MTVKACRICANPSGNKAFCFQEKMFGMGGEFPYFQCGQCGCLQISQIPDDLSPYYPPGYYSFHLQAVPQHGIKAWLAGKRDLASVTGRGLLGRWLGKRVAARPDLACLGRVPLKLPMRILDVGCGKGQLLSILHRAGFPHLEGVDPFLSEDVEVVPGVVVRKLPLKKVTGKFDLIMLHHVFEHVENGGEMLADCRDRLAQDGKILLRIPTVESAAWEKYQTNWVQLDAPRHLFLHTRTSLTHLARQAGLKLLSTHCDSSEFQFWASELYQRGIPLTNPRGKTESPENYFTSEQMKQFANEASVLNANDRGDQFIVLLAKAAS